jgi:hypothetical protein
MGTEPSGWDGSSHFLFGATWSVLWSLALWAYHGFTWLQYREKRRAAAGTTNPEPKPGS